MRNSFEDFFLTILFFCVFFTIGTRIFSLNAPAILIALLLLSLFVVLRDVGKRNTAKASQIKENPYSYKGTKISVIKIALLISLPFCFLVLCLASMPISSPFVWIFIGLAMFLFSFPFQMVFDFCKEFGIKPVTFWGIQLLLQSFFAIIGRMISRIIIQLIS